MTARLKNLLKPLASLKLTVVLIAMAMLLIYAGTWAQIDMNILQVQKKYFHSLFTWIDFQTFLKRPLEGQHRIPGGFPMLGGYTIGLLLLINLLCAHILRFKLTWRDLILIPLLALMVVPLIVWQYNGTDWLFNFVRRFGLDLASFTAIPFFVWVVFVSALLGLPLYLALFTLHAKRGGVIMIHLGLLLLIIGEGITSAKQVERRMDIEEGSSAQYVYDIQNAELAIVDSSNPDHDDHVVIPASILRQRGAIRDARLPFDLHVDEYLINTDIDSKQGKALATAGAGVGIPVAARPHVTGIDAQGVDVPSAFVTISKDGRPLGTYLFTIMRLMSRTRVIHEPQPIEIDGKTYDVQLRFKREYKPYTIHLIDFVHTTYTGSDTPKDFESHLRIVDPARHEDRTLRIQMNEPLRYGGETFFQADWNHDTDRGTVLQVVKNPALVIPYAACTISAVGLLIHLGGSLLRFLKQRSARPKPVIAIEPRRSASPGAAVLFPASVAFACVLLLIYLATPRAPAKEKVDLAGFGALPVSFEGRVVPFDSLARNSLKVLCGKEYFYDGDKTVPPLRFLLEAFTDSKTARSYKLFRIDHPELKSLLSLEEGKKYFSLADILPHGAKFDEQFERLRNVPRTQRNLYDAAIIDLGARLSVFTRLTRIGQLYAAAPARPGAEWQTLGQTGLANPSAEAFVRIVQSYQQSDGDNFSRAVADYRSAVAQSLPRAIEKASFETWFNAFAPFFICCILYFVVFILAVSSWLIWSKPLGRAAFVLLILTVIVHTIGVVSRVYLSGRAPVTNLESTAIFIGWIVVLSGIVMELIFRNALGSVAAAVVGFIALTIYINMAKDDTMKVLQAVLDTNFWLWTHVPAINIGYAATALAWALGATYVILGLFTRRLDEVLRKDLMRMIYGATCFAIIFSFVGTILGGMWADQSWGRFWGWDPKENGAVLIVLANALLLHSRWAGLARERGIACLAIFGGIVTSWSWYGTNLLGVGLHSYGFMEGAMMWLLLFVTTQILLIAIANVPLRWWRSYPRISPAPRPEAKRSEASGITPQTT